MQNFTCWFWNFWFISLTNERDSRWNISLLSELMFFFHVLNYHLVSFSFYVFGVFGCLAPHIWPLTCPHRCLYFTNEAKGFQPEDISSSSSSPTATTFSLWCLKVTSVHLVSWSGVTEDRQSQSQWESLIRQWHSPSKCQKRFLHPLIWCVGKFSEFFSTELT